MISVRRKYVILDSALLNSTGDSNDLSSEPIQMCAL